MPPKELKETPEYKAWAKEISDKYTAQVDDLRFHLSEQYEETRRQKLGDYPIFMAVADSIGYDAVGKPTKTNDFPFITQELKRFIEQIEGGSI